MEEHAGEDAELFALRKKVKGDWARQKRREEKLAAEQEAMVKFYEEQLSQRKAGSAKTSAEINVFKTKLADDKAKREQAFSALVQPRVAPPKEDVRKEPKTRTKESLPSGAIVKVRSEKVRKEVERAMPNESLMPVKERLRAEQQRLNRSSLVQGITFYREQYRARMKKIIEISELPFSEAETARRLGNWHIAKPLSVQEMSRMERFEKGGKRRGANADSGLSRPDFADATDYDKLVPYI
jgi:hypothetical protein